jgi:hypothetical protein
MYRRGPQLVYLIFKKTYSYYAKVLKLRNFEIFFFIFLLKLLLLYYVKIELRDSYRILLE